MECTLKSFQIFAAIACLLPCLPTAAHHSEAAYDASTVAAFEGTVTQYGWRNPHVYITVEVADESGGTAEWLVETGATPILARSGWTPQSLAPGDVISVRGHPDKRPGKQGVILLSLTKQDGTVLAQIGGTPEQRNAVATSLEGVWRGTPSTTSAFSEALDATPLTPAGQAAKAAYDPLADSRAAQCIAPQSPRIITSNVLYLSEIEIGDDVVYIRSEYLDAERVVHMDGRGHPENPEPTPQGHSIGRWEGNALIVDTVAFAEQESVNGQGVPSSTQKHTIERYALTPDGTRMTIDVFLEDPVYLAESFSGQLEWQYAPELTFHRYNCDPEISDVFLH
jgi:hypothetical protein